MFTIVVSCWWQLTVACTGLGGRLESTRVESIASTTSTYCSNDRGEKANVLEHISIDFTTAVYRVKENHALGHFSDFLVLLRTSVCIRCPWYAFYVGYSNWHSGFLFYISLVGYRAVYVYRPTYRVVAFFHLLDRFHLTRS